MKKSQKKSAASAARDEIAPRSRDVESPPPSNSPLAEEQIRIRAYELYRERGGQAGDDMADWLRAEREYFERVGGDEATKPNPPRTTTGGWFTVPKFGSAGSGGAELEPGPERD
jgi:hypothetical protein